MDDESCIAQAPEPVLSQSGQFGSQQQAKDRDSFGSIERQMMETMGSGPRDSLDSLHLAQENSPVKDVKGSDDALNAQTQDAIDGIQGALSVGAQLMGEMRINDTEMGGENQHLKRTHEESEESPGKGGMLNWKPVQEVAFPTQAHLECLPKDVQQQLLSLPPEQQVQRFNDYLNDWLKSLPPKRQAWVNGHDGNEKRFAALLETLNALDAEEGGDY